jgi:hypothetical protein
MRFRHGFGGARLAIINAPEQGDFCPGTGRIIFRNREITQGTTPVHDLASIAPAAAAPIPVPHGLLET